MRQPKHDDVNLTEVKAVLGRLQRIPRKPLAAGGPTEDDTAAAGPAQPAGATSTEDSRLSRPARIPPRVPVPLPVKAAVVIVPMIGVLAGVAVFVGNGGQRAPAAVQADRAPPPDVAPHNPVPARAVPVETQKSQATSLQSASDLIAAGHVQAARDVLLRVASEPSADVAWLLARSYDPNFLVTVRAADAGPDVEQAMRWYRTWYDVAVKQGMVADSVSLDRILRSMNEFR